MTGRTAFPVGMVVCRCGATLRIAVRIDPQYAPALMLLAQINQSRYVPFGLIPNGNRYADQIEDARRRLGTLSN
jgi:hypothetical protein